MTMTREEVMRLKGDDLNRAVSMLVLDHKDEKVPPNLLACKFSVAVVQDAIQRRGLAMEYAQELGTIVIGWRVESILPCFNVEGAARLLMATPEQRCRAALLAVTQVRIEFDAEECETKDAEFTTIPGATVQTGPVSFADHGKEVPIKPPLTVEQINALKDHEVLNAARVHILGQELSWIDKSIGSGFGEIEARREMTNEIVLVAGRGILAKVYTSKLIEVVLGQQGGSYTKGQIHSLLRASESQRCRAALLAWYGHGITGLRTMRYSRCDVAITAGVIHGLSRVEEKVQPDDPPHYIDSSGRFCTKDTSGATEITAPSCTAAQEVDKALSKAMAKQIEELYCGPEHSQMAILPAGFTAKPACCPMLFGCHSLDCEVFRAMPADQQWPRQTVEAYDAERTLVSRLVLINGSRLLLKAMFSNDLNPVDPISAQIVDREFNITAGAAGGRFGCGTFHEVRPGVYEWKPKESAPAFATQTEPMVSAGFNFKKLPQTYTALIVDPNGPRLACDVATGAPILVPRIACECGGDTAKTPHSSWCPKSSQ